MSIINNTYNSTTIANNQIGIAVEDFYYGATAKISIPTLVPFYNNKKQDTQKETINIKNIMNKKSLSINPKAESCNYILLEIPIELCRNQDSYEGCKGDKFLISFIGGDINYPVAVRRL